MNKKIKVIELLNKIANEDSIPKAILYENEEYVFNGESFVCCDHDTTPLLKVINSLTDEVEILEDNTEEIEELKRTENVYDMTLECYHDIEKKISNDELADKINEIIRYIKRKDKNND